MDYHSAYYRVCRMIRNQLDQNIPTEQIIGTFNTLLFVNPENNEQITRLMSEFDRVRSVEGDFTLRNWFLGLSNTFIVMYEGNDLFRRHDRIVPDIDQN